MFCCVGRRVAQIGGVGGGGVGEWVAEGDTGRRPVFNQELNQIFDPCVFASVADLH